MTVLRRAQAMRRRSFLVASAFAVVVAVTGYFVGDALAASKLAAPTLIATPANPTATTTTAPATFTFTDSAGLTFKCGLDSAALAACTSPKSYAALAQGAHSFQVVAFSGSTASNPTTFAWAIVPPTPIIGTHPTDPTAATAAAFTYTDVQSGAGFTCSLDSAAFTSCGAGGIGYPNLAAGAHVFQVAAQVGSNPPSAPSAFSWTITGRSAGKTIAATSGTPQGAMPNTNFGSPLVARVSASNNPIPNASVTFTAPTSGASGAFAAPCSGTTCVVTANASGLATAPAFRANGTSGSYTVTASVAGAAAPASFSLFNGANFVVSGNPATPFSPGLSQSLNVSVTNPNPAVMTIPIGGISLTIDTGNTSCPAFGGTAPNFTFTSVGIAVTVPANTTTPVSLTSLGVPANQLPVLKMNNTPVNQDGCKHATLTLHYAATGSGS